jgi:hypothetical protein
MPSPLPVVNENPPAVLDAPPPPSKPPEHSSQESWPSVLDAPPPPGLAQAAAQRSAEPEPAEITAIRKASTFPFPSPTAKFPPLPGLSTSADSIPPEPIDSAGLVKKMLLIGGLVLVLLAGGGAFAYFKFFANRTANPSDTKTPTTAKPAPKAITLPEAVKKAQHEQQGPINEVVAAENPAVPGADPTATPPAAVVTEPAVVVTPPPAPVVKPPPPAPSLAFKSWVINLRIRGVRGGESPRVFIDKTSYVPGDLVNPQLGIYFVTYEEETRMVVFQDKTGARFERRH